MRSGHSQIECVAAILTLSLLGCHNPCHELEREIALPGWTAKEGMLACRRELKTLARIARPFGSTAKWRDGTVAEEAHIFFALQEALIKADPSVPLAGFTRWPDKVPCSEGVSVSAEAWEKGPLAKWLPDRPQTMHSSFELATTGPADTPILTIRGWQDFNCDGKVGLWESVGRLDRARHLFSQTSYRSSSEITE
jgi:hypothetical protein